ncbi:MULTISPECIES: acyl-CoA thioesterase [Xenorhabdus]|uniref:Long-chain acyl-CoA thioesterase tesC n=5 Tax=Xenorhabdus TaxID=626 RepID=A0A077PP09_XENBV|nr:MULTISPECIES: thioesterase family protein [Xenorhabdus]MCG3462267.1 acyl-CoA thioesterase [Xenorhabdus bovienii]MCG3468971.1 acyl-CoA thioesterase [Xenorhabdus bovienii]MCP9266781.1 acyl-CoA thioesterase [Xenorhabdus bovienii subsp. africana]MDC9621016.1 thioesterase family protein [Xenorhabdus aichiensis]MDE1474430.1 acyl-CoA thioesterase [Xenorhabdus bovienii]
MRTIIKVRGYHIDLFQHVNNARYLEFMEEARWDLLTESDTLTWLKTNNVGFAVVNININYRLPAVFGDELEVRSSLKELRNKSGVFFQEIIRRSDNKVLTDALTTFACIDLKTQKALTLEGDIQERLEAFKV